MNVLFPLNVSLYLVGAHSTLLALISLCNACPFSNNFYFLESYITRSILIHTFACLFCYKFILRLLLSSILLCGHVMVYSPVGEHFGCLLGLEIRNEVTIHIR